MHIHPDLRALRGDDSPQRHAQQAMHRAMARWQAQPGIAPLFDEFKAFAANAPMADCPALAQLFQPGSPQAGQMAAGFIAAALATLETEPLAHLPQRHFHDGTMSTLTLARQGFSTLSLVAIDGQAFHAARPARSAGFWPGEAWELVLAGSASADLVEWRGFRGEAAALPHRPVELAQGSAIARDAASTALVLRRVRGILVTLCLQRRRADGQPSHEVEMASGTVLHRSAGNPTESRSELMMAVLGRMGRRDAASVMAQITGEPGGESLRWQALRECLALDTATGFGALCQVARDAADPLAAPAGALRSQLIETYPQLAGV